MVVDSIKVLLDFEFVCPLPPYRILCLVEVLHYYRHQHPTGGKVHRCAVKIFLDVSRNFLFAVIVFLNSFYCHNSLLPLYFYCCNKIRVAFYRFFCIFFAIVNNSGYVWIINFFVFIKIYPPLSLDGIKK